MGTTTTALIRDRAITVIKALTPVYDTQLRFIPFENEDAAAFREAMNAAPAGAHRQFQVRTTGAGRELEVTNEDVEEDMLEMEVIVAYGRDHRWGEQNALDRDDVMKQDRIAIEGAIGVRGSANFTSANSVDATWLEADFDLPFERGPACDFLVIRQRMLYWLNVAGTGTEEKQVFRYTAVGNEGVTLTISLPAARTSANYNVQASHGGPSANAIKVCRPVVSTFSTTQFQVELSSSAQAGDIYMFTVDDLTV